LRINSGEVVAGAGRFEVAGTVGGYAAVSSTVPAAT
jgi:hypothetical protein